MGREEVRPSSLKRLTWQWMRLAICIRVTRACRKSLKWRRPRNSSLGRRDSVHSSLSAIEQRNKSRNLCALSKLGLDPQLTIYQSEPLFHADEPQAAFLQGFVELEPVPVILDRESDTFPAAPE